MKFTKEKYLSRSYEIQCIFKEVLKEVFASEFSREETLLHSFFIEKRKESFGCVYFDNIQLPEEETASVISDAQLFIRSYLDKKAEHQEYIYRSTGRVSLKNSLCEVYWTLSSRCLDDHQGILLLNCLLQQLTNKFIQFMEFNLDSQQSMGEKELAIQSAEIVSAIEKDIDNYLQKMFQPFQIDWVNILSGEYYERSECKSNIIFLPYGINEILKQEKLLYRFDETPFLPSGRRLIRKWLQMAKDNIYLVLCADKQRDIFNIYGICNIVDLNSKLQSSKGLKFLYLRAEIRKHMLWDLFLNEQYIFTFRNGHYKIECKIQKEYLRKKLIVCFGDQKDNYQVLIDSIINVEDQDHGTILIILKPDAAKKEAKRLGEQKYGFWNSDPQVQAEAVKHLSSIDGSVIIDTYGKIHGIGMILDGLSKEPGELKRGSRYNSLIKYSNALSEFHGHGLVKGLALVISDDGGLDILDI